MLTELHVCQFALIDEVRLEFHPGMTVFSGETGAGKSILVDALGAVFGVRAEREWVRHGAERAEISAVLEGISKSLWIWLEAEGLEPDEQLILRRLISVDGRSRAYINNKPVPIKTLQLLGSRILDQHGQHEHQAMLRPEYQRHLLDERLCPAVLEACRDTFRRWRREKQALADLKAQCDESQKQESWLRDELRRLQALELEDGIGDKLRRQVKNGRHFTQIQEALTTCLSALEDGDPTVRNLLAKCAQALGPVAEFRPEFRECLDILGQMDALLGELEPNLRPILEETFDSQTLARAEDSLMHLQDAMRRHHTDEPGLIRLLDDMEVRISGLETASWDLEKQEKQLQAAAQSYQQAAGKLSKTRNQAADELCLALRPFMDRLALDGMQVRINVESMDMNDSRWSAEGWDEVQFMASSNPGEPFRLLASIASGGELSRLVLALKGSGALKTAPEMAVFDEVDVGIGGETAWSVGELLASMGGDRQVLVVSHLPQVAACANHQIYIRKQEKDGRTLIVFDSLKPPDRLEELARMLGGSSTRSREHAAQMLRRGESA
ncbi:MAG: DNA repair protein RecN [Mariprofundaceae bacterium]